MISSASAANAIVSISWSAELERIPNRWDFLQADSLSLWKGIVWEVPVGCWSRWFRRLENSTKQMKREIHNHARKENEYVDAFSNALSRISGDQWNSPGSFHSIHPAVDGSRSSTSSTSPSRPSAELRPKDIRLHPVSPRQERLFQHSLLPQQNLGSALHPEVLSWQSHSVRISSLVWQCLRVSQDRHAP